MANSDLYGETPTQLIPKMGEFPVSNSAFYKQLVLTGKAGTAGDGIALKGQLDPLAEDDSLEEGPAVGVLLTFEQGWFQEGLALGELRKSLSLAPGEVTKLALVDWRRDTRSEEDAVTEQDEAAQSRVKDASAAESVQTAVAAETKSGMSSESGSAQHGETAGQVGLLFWGVSGSAGVNAHQGYAATSDTSSRNVASSAAKNIERLTEQLAQSTRSVRATQVREVTEKEQQSTTTRVVANYNHAHALTMQYFEVLQIYSLRTRVVNADRCVFIPMKPLEFTKEALKKVDDTVIELLRRVLRDLGADKIDAMVGDFQSGTRDLEQTVKEYETKRDETKQRLESFEANLEALREKLAETGPKMNALIWESLGQGGYTKPAPNSPREYELNKEIAELSAAVGELNKKFRAARSTADATRSALNKELEDIEKKLKAEVETIHESGRMWGLLDQHRMLLNQQMWMRIDEYTWHRKLAGTTYPDAPYKGQPIGSLVDPTPLGYFGNYVAFAWDFPQDAAGAAQAEAFEQMFTKSTSTRTRIALPTEGVFAEAVLGQSNCAEKIDITRFWNWGDSTIPILPPSMTPVGTQSRARAVAAPAPLQFADAVAELRKAGVPEEIADGAILRALEQSLGDNDAVIKAAGEAGRQASQYAAEGAGRAGQRGVDAMKNAQDFTVGLANSEVAKIATEAVVGGATGGVSTVGGLLNAATDVSKLADVIDE